MTMKNGRFEPDDYETILGVLMQNGRDAFGDDLNDDEEAVIRIFYEPIARLLADTQEDLRAVLDSAQLDHADGDALDLLTALIGVSRKGGTFSTGEVEFSRESAASIDYTIPEGTTVQTDGVDPIRFQTSENATLVAGNTTETVPIVANETGVESNIGANTLTVMTNPPSGIESVTNPNATDGGTKKETDEELRARAKDELSDGMRGTSRAIRNELLKTKDVKSVSLFINDSDSTDGDGIPAQHTECVVEDGTDQKVGQTIFDTKGAGDGTHGGAHGNPVTIQADIGNGQTHPVEFSRPNTVSVYVDIELETNANYEGDSKVRDAIVRYLGGEISSGDSEDGELRTGDDVIYTKVMVAALSVAGIEDIPTLYIGKSSSPTGETNITITDTEVATSDANDGSITITQV